MLKLKKEHKPQRIDMTPMVDLGFLLLTFFMLATKFKSVEPEPITIPTSIADTPLPEDNVMSIDIAKSGAVFFRVSNSNTRRAMLEGIITRFGDKYDLNLTDEMKEMFVAQESFGVPIGGMKSWLSALLKEKEMVQPGIPIQKGKNELIVWIEEARLANPKLSVAIKGDQNAEMPVVDRVITSLKAKNINKFYMITNIEGKPADMNQNN